MIAATLLISIASVAQVPQSDHVFVVVAQNHSYSEVIGNTSMPYLNQLASKYGVATQYYANTHPSIGNHLMMTTGQILSNNDAATGTTAVDNIVARLLTSGKTWRSYAEGLPRVGYVGGDTGLYQKSRNPFTYFRNVVQSSTEINNLVPFTRFAQDLSTNQLPNFSFIIPDKCNSAQSCPLSTLDAWLSKNIAPILASQAFQQNGLLIITFDESIATDTTRGGGRVPTLIISPKAKAGYNSTAVYQHQSLLRTVMRSFGMTQFIGAAATAPEMSEFFQSTSTLSAVLNVTPQSGPAPLNVTADSSSSTGTIASRLITFGDGASSTATTATHTYSAPGTYTATLKVTGTNGATSTTSKVITVGVVANKPPVVSPSASPASGTAPLAVKFAPGASDSDGTIASYSWDFGDGQTSTTASPSHSYANAGTYTARLTVKDNAGASATGSVSISVASSTTTPPPTTTGHRKLWLTDAEIQALPMSGTAWTAVKAVADGPMGPAAITCQSDSHDVRTLGVALVAARTGQLSYKTKARDAISAAMAYTAFDCAGGTVLGGYLRNTAAYVIAADVMNLKEFDPALDTRFRTWIRELVNKQMDGSTMQTIASKRPSNVGTLPAAGVVAIAAYLDDRALLDRMYKELRGWLGDRASYSGFATPQDGTTGWFVDPSQPRYVSPVGGVLGSIGKNIDGALPADIVRGGPVGWCPATTDYPYAALSGTYVEAEILYRQGYTDIYEVQSQAVRRTMAFMHRLNTECGWGFPMHHSYKWQPWLINFVYGTSFPTQPLSSANLGQNMGFTDWTHNRRR